MQTFFGSSRNPLQHKGTREESLRACLLGDGGPQISEVTAKVG